MSKRMDLVEEHAKEHGLNRCLRIFSVPKSSQYARIRRRAQPRRDERLHQAIGEVIAANPGYGWRRIQPELVDTHGLHVNHKCLKRVLREHEMGLKRQAARHPKKGPDAIIGQYEGRLNLVRGHSFGPLRAFSTDFTELKYAGGKAWLMTFVDVKSKLAVGWALGHTRNTELAKRSLKGLQETLKKLGLDADKRVIHHDKDGVYRSWAWLRALLVDDDFRVSYSENGARHNPWIESLWSRLKEELASLIAEASTLEELEAIIEKHFAYYNHQRRHSALNNQPPVRYLETRGIRGLCPNLRCGWCTWRVPCPSAFAGAASSSSQDAHRIEISS